MSHYLFHMLLDLCVTVESIRSSMKTSPHFTTITKLFPGFPSIFLFILQFLLSFSDGTLMLVCSALQISVLFTYFSIF